MPFGRRILLTGILVLALSLAFLVRGPSLLEAAPSASNSGLVSAQVQLPTLEQVFLPETIGPGSISTLQFTINNTSGQVLTDIAFTDALPAGLFIATPASPTSTCGVSSQVNAPDGDTTIAFSDGKLAVDQSCAVTVNVTSSAAGTHTNLSGNLTSSVGTSGTSTADLTVATDRPGFTKSFSPATIQKGERSRLTFTIDNILNTAGVYNLTFTDVLPTGLVVASPRNIVSTCTNGTLTASSGRGMISFTPQSFGGGSVSAGATCTIAIDVLATGIGIGLQGEMRNTTGDLTSTTQFGGTVRSSGKAGAILYVPFDFLRLEKSFVDDPITPGGTGTLQFTVRNFDRGQDVTNITFTDDLDAALSGLVALDLPINDVCGTDSQLSGTNVLSFSGGSLGAEESCTFTVTVQVPSTATPGSYVNTTSNISGDYDGVSYPGASASDTLFVEPTPLLTKTFTDDPVGAGGTVMLEFSITNTSPDQTATDITFSDTFDVVLRTASSVPANGSVCGGSSNFSFTPFFNPPAPSDAVKAIFTLTGGSLAAGETCTFSLVLDVAEGAPTGTYNNTTSGISAVIDGATVTGSPASDTLEIVAAPSLRKEFTDGPVLPGDTVTLEFTLTHDNNAPGDATDINFTDDLNAVLSGLMATGLPQNDICGTGSSISGTSNLSFTGGILSPGESCTFSVILAVPTTATPGNHPNTTSNVSATVLGVTTVGNPASDVLKIATLTLTKSFTNDPVLPGGTVTLEFTIDNLSAGDDATAISFQDDLDDTLDGLVATGLPLADICGTGSSLTGFSGNSLLAFQGGSLPSGTSCTFSVDLSVPSNALSDSYRNRTSGFSATFDAQTIQFENASDTLVVNGEILALSKTFTNDPVLPGETVNLSFTLLNLSSVYTVTGIGFTDNLNAALSGLASNSDAQNNICGSGSQISGAGMLSFTGGILPPGASCTINVTVLVPSNAVNGSVAINTTSGVSGLVGSVPVAGAAATDKLQIANVVITAEAGGPYTLAEGSSLVITGTTTTPGNVTYEWDLDNDVNGNFETPGQVVTLTPADGDSSFTIRLRVRGTSGNGAIDTATVNVVNVAPTIALSGAASVNEGSSYALTLGAVTDPGDDTVSQYIIHWGDGSPDTTTASPGVVSHTYDDGPSTSTIVVDLVDEDGTFVAAGSLAVAVDNVAPSAIFNAPAVVNEGQPIPLSLSGESDPSNTDTTAGFTYAFDCGNGALTTAAVPNTTCPTAGNAGWRTVRGEITDKDGGNTIYSADVYVKPSREVKEDLRDDLQSLLPTGDSKDDKDIEKAIDSVNHSLDDKYWESGSRLTKKGNKVFDEEKKAVKDLQKVDETDVSVFIFGFVEVDRVLAAVQIADAEAANGEPKYLDKAYERMADALDEINEGDFDKAIDDYKKAWEYARKAANEPVEAASIDMEGDFEANFSIFLPMSSK